MASYAVSVRVADGFGYISFYFSGVECCYTTGGSYDRTTGFTDDGSLRLSPETGYTLDRVEWYRAHGPGEWETIYASDMTYTGGQYRYTVTSDMYNLNSGSDDELWFDAYFVEDTGSGGGGGESGGDDTDTGSDWYFSTRGDFTDATDEVSISIGAGQIQRIYYTPSVDGTITITADTDGDTCGWLYLGTSSVTYNESVVSEGSFVLTGTEITFNDDGSGSDFLMTSDLTADTEYVIFAHGYDDSETANGWIYLDFVPDVITYSRWQTPTSIRTVSGTSYTSYSNTDTINRYSAGRFAYTTPAYIGRLTFKTTSTSSTPDFYGYLSSTTLSANSGTSRTSSVVTTSSTITDDNSGGTKNPKCVMTGCSASTTYYWYVNGPFEGTGTYSVPWTVTYDRRYTISFNANGGSGAPSSQYYYVNDTTVTLSSTKPTRSGYNFLGWSTSSTATSASYSAGGSMSVSGKAANITLYAVWEQQIGRIIYNANGGTGAPAEHTFTTSPVALSSTEPTRSGYEFLGWSTSSSATAAQYQPGVSYAFSTLGSTTLYAVWSIINYTVIYDMNGGTDVFPQQTFNANNRVVTINSTIPTRTGYTFIGWSETKTATTSSYTAGNTYTLSLKHYTLYAIWKAKTYTISYNANGGTGTISSQTKTYGTNITLASSGFTRSGYSLSHWNTQSDGSGLSYNLGSSYADAGAVNVTLYAIWSVGEYSLIYNANGGTGGPGADAKKFGSRWKINVVTAPSRTNYTFKGWAESDTAITPLYKTKTFPTTEIDVTLGNKTLYAVWWPHFEWTAQTKEYANLLVDYIKTYLNKTVSKITDTTSLLYLTDWYNEVATALDIETLPANTIIQTTHLEDLANAFNSY